MGGPVPEKRLHEMASSLGSDCPFFLYGTPMLAEGRGEILNPLQLDLEGLCLVLFFTEIHISTAEAYSGIQPFTEVPDLQDIQHRPISGWKEFLKNDFEVPVYRKYPELELMKRSIYREGALYVSLSGSGSAMYGLFQDIPDLPGDLKGSVVWREIL
jgi:4-diphosphocytidyl-2-C-methyl-D-erythritol kinase